MGGDLPPCGGASCSEGHTCTWCWGVRQSASRKQRRRAPDTVVPSEYSGTFSGSSIPRGGGARRPLPRTAAIVICRAEGASYAEILRRARVGITPAVDGVPDLRVRRAMNGSLLLVVPGEQREAVADRLAGCLRDILGGDANVSRPCRTGEVRVVGLDDSILPKDVEDSLASATGLTAEKFQVGPISGGFRIGMELSESAAR